MPIIKKRTTGIHSGDKTHHQDQSIKLVNFKPINKSVKSVIMFIEEFVAVSIVFRVLKRAAFYNRPLGLLIKMEDRHRLPRPPVLEFEALLFQCLTVARCFALRKIYRSVLALNQG